MDKQLLESVYRFNLSDKELGKLRKLRGTLPIINKINGISGVRGITIDDKGITLKVEPRPGDVAEKIVGKAETIIKDQLV